MGEDLPNFYIMRVLRILVLVYLLLCGIFYFGQHLVLFQPKKLDTNHLLRFPMKIRFEETTISPDAATVIDVVKFMPDSGSPRGVVLFFHGNRFNVEHYSTYAPYFTKMGYECWMPDYPGYGKSRGRLDIETIQKMSVALYRAAEARFPPAQISIYGKSLGTGIAAFLASKYACRQLILETPYYSLQSLMEGILFFLPVKWLIRYNLDTYQFLDRIKAPITILHGAEDELIPFDNALRLLGHAKKGDVFYTFPGGRHNDLPTFRLYHQVVDSLLRN